MTLEVQRIARTIVEYDTLVSITYKTKLRPETCEYTFHEFITKEWFFYNFMKEHPDICYKDIVDLNINNIRKERRETIAEMKERERKERSDCK